MNPRHPSSNLPPEIHDHPHGALESANAYLATRKVYSDTMYSATRRVDKRFAGDKSFVAPTLARLYDLIACAEPDGLDALAHYDGVMLTNNPKNAHQYLSGVDDNGMHLYRLDFAIALHDKRIDFVPYNKHPDLAEFAEKRRVSRRRYEQVERRAWSGEPFEPEVEQVNFLLFDASERLCARSQYAAETFLKGRYATADASVTCERYTYGEKDAPTVVATTHVSIRFD